MTIPHTQKEVKKELEKRGVESKEYLKENYVEEIFNVHNIEDFEVDFLFDVKKIISISPHASKSGRLVAMINAGKKRKLRIIFEFDPVKKGKKLIGKTGIITVFKP